MRGPSATPSTPLKKASTGPRSREVTSEVDTQAIHAAALNATRATAPDLMMTRTGPMPAVRPARSGVFVAYSHRDRDLLGELQVHLKPLQKAWMLDLWDDIRVDHGPRGAAELRHAIDSARVALLLISPGFLASPFVEEHHLPVTLAAQTHPRAAVMCIYLRPAMDVFADYAFSDPITGNPRSVRITNFHALNDPTCPLAALERPARAGILAAAAEEIIAAAHRPPAPSYSEL